jgi:hypothetical protein
MKTPTETQLEATLQHLYDPQQAHEYYMRTRELKGRRPGNGVTKPTGGTRTRSVAPRTGRTREQIAKSAKAQQRKELKAQIDATQERLNKLEALIKKRITEEKADNRKGKAKKERAAKDAQKPATAAEKAKQAREAAKYRDKHKQQLKTKAKAKDAKTSGGSSAKKGSVNKKHSVDELQTLAKKVRGQLALAKQKLAAL